jgi:hypothetical protein
MTVLNSYNIILDLILVNRGDYSSVITDSEYGNLQNYTESFLKN